MRKKIVRALVGMALLFFPIFINAQNIDDIGKIALGVAIPPDSNEDTKALSDFLQNKIRNIVANAGYSSYGEGAFVVVPSIVINDIEKVEGGMKIIYKADGELFLTVQEGMSGTVYGNCSSHLNGTGMSKESAIKNAVQKADMSKTVQLLNKSKERILQYYTSKQQQLFAKADMYVQQKDYDAAISCLMMIPEELSDLHQKAYDKACRIYKQKEQLEAAAQVTRTNKDNGQCLSIARSNIAAHNAIAALQTLKGYVLTGSDQDNEYHSLMQQAESMISKEELASLEKEKEEQEYKRMKEERAYADSRQEYNDQVELANRRLDIQEKKIDAEKESQSNMNETLKTIALNYIKKGKKLF